MATLVIKEKECLLTSSGSGVEPASSGSARHDHGTVPLKRHPGFPRFLHLVVLATKRETIVR